MTRSLSHHARTLVLLVLPLLLLALAACGEDERPAAPGIDDGPAAEAPPEDDSEGVVEQGDAAAELVADPERITPDGETTVTVVNHGDEPLNYGRPIEVERWDGEAWVRWEPADEAVWTMEMLIVEPGESGVEQTFPFTEEAPEPGWYRLTKQLFAETDGSDGEILVRTQVHVESD